MGMFSVCEVDGQKMACFHYPFIPLNVWRESLELPLYANIVWDHSYTEDMVPLKEMGLKVEKEAPELTVNTSLILL